ncbi:MAG TPA: hypothetical protein VFU22_32150, partial [Roseiflexaceae bacterium]|nr:hypothetical protein [Roseiflexaceae bacterium]
AAGKNTWYYPATPNPLDPDLVYATSGKNNFWGYDQGSNSNIPAVPADYSIAMTRDVAIPAGAHLHFRHAFELERDTTGVYDGGVVEYSDDGGGTWNDAGPLFSENGYTGVIDAMSSNPLHGRQVFSGNSRGYYSSRLDLSALAGQDVRFRFRIGTDQYVDALGWFIDDIRVYTCGVTVPVASLQTVSAMVAEESGSLAIQLNMSGVADQAISVPFAVGGTASEGADYRLSGHAFVIPAGQASGEVVVELANDRLEEPTETLTLNLGTPAGATLGNATQATVTIVDTDVTYLSYLALFSK